MLYHREFYSRAKVLLRKKRYQEQLLKETDGQVENIAKLIGDLEKAQIDAKVYNITQSEIISMWQNYITLGVLFRLLKLWK